jgi:hypothetical protein
MVKRLLTWALVGGFVLGTHVRAEAEAPTAPVAVQAQIATRILPFERGFRSLGDDVVVVIAEKKDDTDSSSATRQMERALGEIGSVGGKRLSVVVVPYAGAAAFADECRKRRAAVAYLTPGLGGEVRDLASKLEGTGVLSIAAVESYVAAGAVLGVEVVSGKPRMSINLRQAKLQRVDFPSAVLKLARVYQ